MEIKRITAETLPEAMELVWQVFLEYQGMKIGRQLFDHVSALCASDAITVNSSPYAVKIYRKLGFLETDEEQLTNGIRYIPMRYQK